MLHVHLIRRLDRAINKLCEIRNEANRAYGLVDLNLDEELDRVEESVELLSQELDEELS